MCYFFLYIIYRKNIKIRSEDLKLNYKIGNKKRAENPLPLLIYETKEIIISTFIKILNLSRFLQSASLSFDIYKHEKKQNRSFHFNFYLISSARINPHYEMYSMT